MMKPRNTFMLISTVVIVIAVLFSLGNLIENVDAEEIVVIQYPNGSFNIATEPGWTTQWFGKVTRYPRVNEYLFDKKIRFNDGGGAAMIGSINWKMPLAVADIRALHMDFGSKEAVDEGLVMPIVNRCVYMTGPLMSSKQSYAEKRPELLEYISDQIDNGVYQTVSKEVKTTDPITGADKTVTLVEIQFDENGQQLRQEEALLKQYSVTTFNFSIDKIPYDARVEEQIKGQQQRIMDVQTAMAEAKKAEQATLTTVEQGKAAAAKAKWAQEEIKATEVTKAEQKLEVAELAAKEAAQYKKAKILRAEGDAAYKKKVMMADGALEQKLAAYVEVQKYWAENIPKYTGQWVPNIIMGENGSAGANSSAQALINMLSVKTAKDLSLDMRVSSNKP